MRFVEYKTRTFRWILALMIIAGVSLRFAHLGSTPLSEAETELALQSLDWSKGIANFSVSQPLYVGSTALLFRFFGASAFLARFFSAFCGSLLLFIPLTMQKRLSGSKTLALTFVLAFNPVLLSWSRLADGAILVLTALLFSLISLCHKKNILTIFLFCLAFVSGLRFFPLIFTALVTLILLSVLDILFFSSLLRPVFFLKNRWDRKNGTTRVILLVLFVAGLLIFPPSLNGLGNAFLQIFTRSGYLQLEFMPAIIAFAIYLLIPLILLGYSAVCGIKCSRFVPIFCLFGIVISAVILLIIGQGVLSILWLTIPLWVAAIETSDSIQPKIGKSLREVTILSASILPTLIFFLILRFSEISRLGDLSLPLVINWQQQQVALPLTRGAAYLAIFLFCIVIFAVLLPIFLSSIYPGKVRPGMIYGLVIIFIFSSFHQSWSAAGFNTGSDFYQMRHHASSHELALGQPRHRVPNEIQAIVKEISLQTTGFSEKGKGLISVTNDATLRWEFRDNSNIRFSSVLNLREDPPAFVITDHGSENQALNAGYKGLVSDWNAITRWGQFNFIDWINWLLYRQPLEDIQRVTIWQQNRLLLDSDE